MVDIVRQTITLENIFSKKIDLSKYDEPLLLVGCGGIGSVLGQLLVRGGFSNINLFDYDVVDSTNLQRQLYTQKDIGKPKVEALKEILLEINPNISVSINSSAFSRKHEKKYSLIFDATDTVNSRIEINEFAKKTSTPWIYSGAIESKSICYLFNEANDKEFNALFPGKNEHQSCENGVLASSTMIAASFAYACFLEHLLSENKQPVIRYDCLLNSFSKFKL